MKSNKPNAYISGLMEAAAQALSTTPKDLTGSERTRPLPIMRSLIARELRCSGLSLPKCGAILNRDHSTVCYYIQSIEQPLLYPCPDEKEIMLVWRNFIRTYRLNYASQQ